MKTSFKLVSKLLSFTTLGLFLFMGNAHANLKASHLVKKYLEKTVSLNPHDSAEPELVEIVDSLGNDLTNLNKAYAEINSYREKVSQNQATVSASANTVQLIESERLLRMSVLVSDRIYDLGQSSSYASNTKGDEDKK
jgi:uncharacterized protein with von Willebrand factor type A (vWA) domain